MMILPNDLHIDMALDVSYLVLSKIAQSFTDTLDFDVIKIQHIVILFLEYASIDPYCKISL